MKTEGRNAVIELLKTGKQIEKILLEKGEKGTPQGSLSLIFAEARKKNVRVQFVDRRVLDKESETHRHQGVIAFTTEYEYFDLDDIIAEKRAKRAGSSCFATALKTCIIWVAFFVCANARAWTGWLFPKTAARR